MRSDSEDIGRLMLYQAFAAKSLRASVTQARACEVMATASEDRVMKRKPLSNNAKAEAVNLNQQNQNANIQNQQQQQQLNQQVQQAEAQNQAQRNALATQMILNNKPYQVPIPQSTTPYQIPQLQAPQLQSPKNTNCRMIGNTMNCTTY